MTLDKLTLKNFKGSGSNIEVRFDNKITYLIGINGSGKTLIGWALQYLLDESKTFFNSKYRRRMITEGADKLKVGGEFIDKKTGKTLIIKKSNTSNDNPRLVIKSSDNSINTIEDVLKMIDPLFLRPFDIIKHTPKEQAQLIGVDTTKHDESIRNAKAVLVPFRSDINRYKKVLESYEEIPEKIEVVDILALVNEKQKIIDFNDVQKTNQLVAEQLKKEIEKAKENLINAQKHFDSLPKSVSLKSIIEIDNKIASVNEVNAKAFAYQEYKKIEEQQQEAIKSFAEEQKNIEKAQQDKIDYIHSCKVMKGISFDDEGGLQISAFGQKDAYLNESFFSRGQIIKMSIQFAIKKILKAREEKQEVIPLIFIDNAESLDKDNQKYIQEMVDKHKIQVVMTIVGDKPKAGQHSIMIYEKMIKGYKE